MESVIEYNITPRTRRAGFYGFVLGLLVGIGLTLAVNGLRIHVHIHPATPSAPAAS